MLTDNPDMTIAINCGRKNSYTTTTTKLSSLSFIFILFFGIINAYSVSWRISCMRLAEYGGKSVEKLEKKV